MDAIEEELYEESLEDISDGKSSMTFEKPEEPLVIEQGPQNQMKKSESMPRIPEEGLRNNPEDNQTPKMQNYYSQTSVDARVDEEGRFEKPRALSMSASKQSLKIKKILTIGTGGDN